MSVISKNLITFPHDPATTNSVAVAGAFSDWLPLSMTYNDSSKEWEFDLYDYLISHKSKEDIIDQKFMYKFILNGDNWCCNILKPIVKDDSGNDNNILIITAPSNITEYTASTDATAQPTEEEPIASSSASSQSPVQEPLEPQLLSSLSSIHSEEEHASELKSSSQVDIRDSDEENNGAEVTSTSKNIAKLDQGHSVFKFFHWLWKFILAKMFGADLGKDDQSKDAGKSHTET